MRAAEAMLIFKLTREEQNLLDKATAANLASIDRQPLRAQMGCKE